MENIRINRAMGELGTALFPDGARAHIFCNVGALATGLDDRVFGVFRLEVEAGKKISVTTISISMASHFINLPKIVI